MSSRTTPPAAGLSAALKMLKIEHQYRNALILRRGANAVGQIPQQRLGALERITSEDTGARQFKASLWVTVGVLISLGYLIVVLISSHTI